MSHDCEHPSGTDRFMGLASSSESNIERWHHNQRRRSMTDLRAAGAELGQQTGRDLVFFLQIKASKS